jgi:uncharacterized protein YndB with AHSA1/START domain
MTRSSPHQPAKLGGFTTRDSVTIERLLPGSVDQVWDYLSNPTRLKRWLAGGTIDLRKGGAIHLDFDLIECPGREHIHGTMDGAITTFDRPHLIAYSWGEKASRRAGVPDSHVRFELKPRGKHQTFLTLTHSRLVTKEMPPVAAGWHMHVNVLESRLGGHEPSDFEQGYQALEPQYRQLLEPTGHRD